LPVDVGEAELDGVLGVVGSFLRIKQMVRLGIGDAGVLAVGLGGGYGVTGEVDFVEVGEGIGLCGFGEA
jgi:hypothetical protein